MSATNRGAIRHKDDFYATPAWCVRALLKSCPLPGGNWLEPAVGDGAIVRAVDEMRRDVFWTINDINLSRIGDLSAYGMAEVPYPITGLEPEEMQDVVITNPPFSQSLEFVQGALKDGKIVVMLLRLNWLASQKRNRFLLTNPPSVYVLPRRPSFTADGKTDCIDYAWFIWGMDATPTVRVIDSEVCR